MNTLIPDSWLKEYLNTKADAKTIAKYLSLCGASVARINKVGDDWIYDIEITSNRIDMAGVAGIAREAAAILPQFGIKAKLNTFPEISKLNLKISHKVNYLKVIMADNNICPRFTAILINNVKVKPSPLIIQERLKKVGVRSLNNIIDISNILMHEFGQPVHVFDYDKIHKSTMCMRESVKGEKIITLDGKIQILPGKDIVIEDGDGRLIDLCGIMGGANSAIGEQTENVLLFVQTYEPSHIRKTSMTLGQRTEAASLFEKGVDPQLVMPTLQKGIDLMQKYASAKIINNILDIYPNPLNKKTINIALQLIEKYLGIPIQLTKVIKILQSLGFKTSPITNHPARRCYASSVAGGQSLITIIVPSWRANDISIPQDIIEEIARIYGYHNLPSLLPSGQLPLRPSKQSFDLELFIKTMLSNWGFTEVCNYAMQSENQLTNCLINPSDCLKIANPLTKDWVYMRNNILPSILSNINQNQNLDSNLKIFELGKIYLKQTNDLPKEKIQLVIALIGKNKFYELKGFMEALLTKLNLTNYGLSTKKLLEYFDPIQQAQIIKENRNIGYLAKVNHKVILNYNLKNNVYVLILDILQILDLRLDSKSFTPIPLYPPIIEDLSFQFNKNIAYVDIIKLMQSTSNLITKIMLIDSYQTSKTFRIYYQHPQKNLTSKDVLEIRNKIITIIKKMGWAELKEKVKD